MTPAEKLDECAKAALDADFDPVAWEAAPEWRRSAMRAVAQTALETTNPDRARMAWFTEMCRMGWRWDPVIDEVKKTHPGIVTGELTRGGAKHWEAVIARVRAAGRLVGARMTGP